jgi:hypothetical protein
MVLLETFYFQSRKAKMYKIHPGFFKTAGGLFKNDLALVFAATPFDLRASNKVQTIALPPPANPPGDIATPKRQRGVF